MARGKGSRVGHRTSEGGLICSMIENRSLLYSLLYRVGTYSLSSIKLPPQGKRKKKKKKQKESKNPANPPLLSAHTHTEKERNHSSYTKPGASSSLGQNLVLPIPTDSCSAKADIYNNSCPGSPEL